MSHSDSLLHRDSTALDDVCRQAMGLQLAGQLDLAAQLYGRILSTEPKHAAANHGIGMLNIQRQRAADALPYLLAALESEPQLPDYWLGYLEGLLLTGASDEARITLQLGRQHGLAGAAVEEFVGRLERAMLPPGPAVAPAAGPAVALAPGATVSGARQGTPATRAGRRRESRAAHGEELQLLSLVKQGRLAEALTLSGTLTEIHAERGLAWKVRGALLWADGREGDALAAMRVSARLLPEDAEAHSNFGRSLNKFERFDEAEIHLRRALDIDPEFILAHAHLGDTYHLQGRYDKAEAHLRKAITLRAECLNQYDDISSSSLLFTMSHNPATDAQSLFAEHCRVGDEFERGLRALWPRHANIPDPSRCIKIGIVSGDLRKHAVASFLEPALATLSLSKKLQFTAYSNNGDEDHVSRRLRGYFAHWHSVAAFSDTKLAATIVADGIDILIDLSGHTGLHRLRTFARKPAPIQVSWIGYPGSTGLRAMDYYLTDRCWLPPEQFDEQFIEKLVCLPAAALFQPEAAAPAVNPLPALATGYITFGSFNRLGKISQMTIGLWSQLLRALPESRVILGSVPLGSQRDSLIDRFAREGVARERLTFHPRSAMDSYLALHLQMDMCLDTFPYTGGTTTQHALWMGVPTLTIAGATPAARQGAGIMGRVGLDAFIARDAADFVAKGTYWGAHLEALAELRAGLRERFRQSPSQQHDILVRALEQAFRRMWERWCAGLAAESFEITGSDRVA